MIQKNIYKGNRYVPYFPKGEEINWNKEKEYESLTVVLYQGDSYTSRTDVPRGIDISNINYWVKTGNYNGSLSIVDNKVDDLTNQFNEYKVLADDKFGEVDTDVTSLLNSNQFVSVLQFGAKGDGVTDDTKAIQDTFNYCSTRGKTVFFPTPAAHYKITDSLLFNANVWMEDFNYLGFIIAYNKSDNTRYTAITFDPYKCKYVKNLSVGAKDRTTNCDGVYLKAYTGFFNWENIRITNFNGFGLKLEAIYDSVFTHLSVEFCGNENNYAFSVINGTDTSNESLFNRIQVEQSYRKAMFMEGLHLQVNNIHSERVYNQTGDKTHSFMGDTCTYTNCRIDGGTTFEIITIGGTSTFEDFRTTGDINFLRADRMRSIIRGLKCREFKVDSNTLNDGDYCSITIYDSNIVKIYVTWYMDIFNSILQYVENVYIETRLSLNKCIVYNIGGSEQLRLTGTECKFGNSVNLTVVGATFKLYKCYLGAPVIKSAYNTYIELVQSECDTITLDGSNATIKLRDCNIYNVLNYVGGFAVGYIDDKTKVGGSIDVASWCGPYTFGGGRTFTVGEKRYNPKAKTGEYIGHIYTVNGWKGFGLIA